MVQPKTQNSRRNLARSLRNGGYSYSEIQKFVSVPKATLSYWFRDIALSSPQRDRLLQKRSEASRRGAAERSRRVSEAIQEIQKNSSREIGTISRRELWLMGVMLYWRNFNQADVKKGVHFSSTDPQLIRLFLKWLKEIGQLDNSEITFDVFMRSKNTADILQYWTEQTGFLQEAFHVYRYKRGASLKANYGLLRIRVRASSMLARQLSGWIQGIQAFLDASRVR
jgi:hypothetical protein